MVTLNINKIVGCLAKQNCTIYQNGSIFYVAKKNRKFNLPIGKYSSEFNLTFCKPLNFKKYLKIIPHEKNIKFLGIKEIQTTYNPNKCSIYVETGKIIRDKDFFKQLNKIQKDFIMLHEIGHYYYFTEKYCDNFSRCILLLNGYNPSQISAAAKSTLIDKFRQLQLKKDLIK